MNVVVSRYQWIAGVIIFYGYCHAKELFATIVVRFQEIIQVRTNERVDILDPQNRRQNIKAADQKNVIQKTNSH